MPTFEPDLYKGTAAFYDRFRRGYPGELIDDLLCRAEVEPGDVALDLACGTGQVAMALAAKVGSVLAVDQEPEFVSLAEHKARDMGVDNIDWVVATAEDVELPGPFRLITIASAFHRLDRDRVARRLRGALAPNGHLALIWGGTPWRGSEPWQRAVQATLDDWVVRTESLGRSPSSWEPAMHEAPHAEVLRRAGYEYEGTFRFEVEEEWDLQSIIGLVYSTSYLNRGVLGNRSDAFEAELRDNLQAHLSAGLIYRSTYRYELARPAARHT